jgi:hypothetical protein
LPLIIFGVFAVFAPPSSDPIKWEYVPWAARLPLFFHCDGRDLCAMAAVIVLPAFFGFWSKSHGGHHVLLWVHAITAAIFAILLVISPIWLMIMGYIRVGENLWSRYEFSVGEIVERVIPGTILISPAAYAFVVYVVRARIAANTARRQGPSSPGGAGREPIVN